MSGFLLGTSISQEHSECRGDDVTGLYPGDHTEYVAEYYPRSRAETRLACQLFRHGKYKFFEIHPDRGVFYQQELRFLSH